VRTTLDTFRTPKAARIEALVKTVERDGGTYAEWAAQFVDQATILREIARSVDVVDRDGDRRSLPWHLYTATPELATMPSRYDPERDRLEILIDEPVSQPGGILSRLGGAPPLDEVETFWPHSRGVEEIPRHRAVEVFLRRLDEALEGRRSGARRHPAAMAAARHLVQLTRIVPLPPERQRTTAAPSGAEIW
jgi:hypothetical protein